MFSFWNKFSVVKHWLQGISVHNIKSTLLYVVPFELKKPQNTIAPINIFYCRMGIECTENY